MLATELLFVYVYCLIDDAIKAGVLSIPRRPGPAPACTHAERLTIAVVGHLLGREAERLPGRDPPRLAGPVPAPAGPAGGQPAHPLAMGRLQQPRRLGRGRARRSGSADRYLRDPGQAPLPGPRPERWTGPDNDLAARFGRDGAHAEWFYGFRLAIRTDLGRRIVRAWSLVPAAMDECHIGTNLITGDAAAIDALLLDKGFTSRRFAAEIASAGIEVIIPPTRAQRQTMPRTLQRLIARLRNRVETSFKEITDQMDLARHGAHTFEGLPPGSSPLSAHTLLLTELTDAM